MFQINVWGWHVVYFVRLCNNSSLVEPVVCDLIIVEMGLSTLKNGSCEILTFLTEGLEQLCHFTGTFCAGCEETTV